MKTELIIELSDLWMNWMVNHMKSNNEDLSLKRRRTAGEECEALQKIRQRLLIELDKDIECAIT